MLPQMGKMGTLKLGLRGTYIFTCFSLGDTECGNYFTFEQVWGGVLYLSLAPWFMIHPYSLLRLLILCEINVTYDGTQSRLKGLFII